MAPGVSSQRDSRVTIPRRTASETALGARNTRRYETCPSYVHAGGQAVGGGAMEADGGTGQVAAAGSAGTGDSGRSHLGPGFSEVVHFGWPSLFLVPAFWVSWGLLMGGGFHVPPGSQLSSPIDLTWVGLLEGCAWAILTFPLIAVAARVDCYSDGWALRVSGLVLMGALQAAIVAVVVCTIAEVSLFEFSEGAFAGVAGQRVAFTELFDHSLLAALIVVATGVARGTVLRYRRRQEETSRLRTQLADSRCRALGAQLAPHLLLNTMNTIAGLVATEPALARTIITDLCALLRGALRGATEGEVSVSKEMETVQSYLNIMGTRFSGSLKSLVHMAPGVAGAMVPPFILQPLVENSVKHAVRRRDPRATVTVTVDAAAMGDSLTLSVVDDGPGVPDSVKDGGGGLGLDIVRTRLASTYGDEARLVLSTPEAGGTRAEVQLPLRLEAKS